MEITVDVSRLDIVRVTAIVLRKVTWIRIALVMLFLAGIALSTPMWSPQPSIVDIALIALNVGLQLASVLIVSILFVVIPASFFGASKQTGLGEHQFFLQADGLLDKTDLTEEFSKWRSFGQIWQTRNYIILKRSTAAVHAFPKRYFASDEEFHQFYEILKDRLTKSRSEQKSS